MTHAKSDSSWTVRFRPKCLLVEIQSTLVILLVECNASLAQKRWYVVNALKGKTISFLTLYRGIHFLNSLYTCVIIFSYG